MQFSLPNSYRYQRSPVDVFDSSAGLRLRRLAGLGAASVVFTTSRGTTNLQMGDTWQVQITGAAPNSPVIASRSHPDGSEYSTATLGTSDVNGNFTLSGTIDSNSYIGTWVEFWHVGGTTVGSYTFTVGGQQYPVNRCSNTYAYQRVNYQSDSPTGATIDSDVIRSVDCGCPGAGINTWNPAVSQCLLPTVAPPTVTPTVPPQAIPIPPPAVTPPATTPLPPTVTPGACGSNTVSLGGSCIPYWGLGAAAGLLLLLVVKR